MDVSLIIENKRGLTVSLAAFALIFIVARRWLSKQSGKKVVSVFDRHKIASGPTTHRYVAVGKGEYQYIRLHQEQHGAHKLFLIASLRGARVKVSKLAFAADCIQRKHPTLRCRLTKVDGQTVLEEVEGLKLNLNVRSRNGPESCRQAFREIEHKQMDISDSAGSPHSLWLFQSDTPDPSGVESSEIVLDLAHFCIDGSGLAPLLHDVLYYTLDPKAQEPEYGPWPATQEFGLHQTMSREVGPIRRLFMQYLQFNRMLYDVFIPEHINLPHDQTSPVSEWGKSNETFCECTTLNEIETSRLIAKCKEQKVSVTTAISSAYLEACAEILYPKYNRPFKVILNLVADSRRISTPPIPATDLAPHVYFLHGFRSKARTWEERKDLTRTWDLASEMRNFIQDYLAKPIYAAAFADLMAFCFSFAPAKGPVPMMNASSWCASAPVLKEYAGTVVEDVEFMQNMAFHTWANISIYTFVNKLHVSFFAPVPRFDKHLLEDVTKRASGKLKAMSI